VAGPDKIASGPFTLQPISGTEMDSVVSLHQMALGYSFNSRLGNGHLRYLYSSMQQDATCLSIVAVLEGEVLGLVCAALDPETLTHRLLTGLPAWRWVALLGRIAFQPSLWPQLIKSRRLNQPVIFQGLTVKPCLTVIAVSPAARRCGVGRTLVEAVDDFMHRHGRSCYYLDTRLDNSKARAFYSRLGFIELEVHGPDVIIVRHL
jgi:ribosomal protein S18 acetylase RimI-like enzyme